MALPPWSSGCGLASDDDLHWPFRVAQNPAEPFLVVQQQVRPLVSGESPGKPQGDSIWVEYALRLLDGRRRRIPLAKLPLQPQAHVLDEAFPGLGAIVPQALVGDPCDSLGRCSHVAQPWPVHAVGLAPEHVGRLRMPGGNVYAVGHGTDGDFSFGPAGEQHLKKALAHLSVQAGHAVDVATSAHRQVGHVERLAGIRRVAASQGEKGLAGQSCLAHKRLGRLADQVRLEPVEGGFHGGVGREHVPCPRGPQRHPEGNFVLFRKALCAGEHGKRRMTFVHVADLDLDPQLLQQPPTADAQHQLLQQPLLFPGRVQVGRDAAVPRAVQGVIAVQQIQVHLAHAGVPDPQVERSPRQFEWHRAASGRRHRGPA